LGDREGPHSLVTVSVPTVLLSGADADLQEAFNRLEDFREGLGVEFMLMVDACLARLGAFPKLAPLYFRNVRRLVAPRFYLGIFYESHPTRIVVLALLDLRQDEEQILKRLKLGIDD
jgi:hypothetical protein